MFSLHQGVPQMLQLVLSRIHSNSTSTGSELDRHAAHSAVFSYNLTATSLGSKRPFPVPPFLPVQTVFLPQQARSQRSHHHANEDPEAQPTSRDPRAQSRDDSHCIANAWVTRPFWAWRQVDLVTLSVSPRIPCLLHSGLSLAPFQLAEFRVSVNPSPCPYC